LLVAPRPERATLLHRCLATQAQDIHFEEGKMFRASLAMMAVASLALACDRGPTTPTSPDDPVIAADAGQKASDGPSVKGKGTIHFGTSVEKVSVNTRGNSGKASFHDKTVSGNVNGKIDVNCVRVVGNEATISGIVRHSNRKELEGYEALFQIRDNGKGKKKNPDYMSPVLFHAVGTGPDCSVPSEFDLAPVKGDFTVKP
jgi:hypothetical protein